MTASSLTDVPHRLRPPMTDPAAVMVEVGPRLAGHDRERCLLLSLDVRHRLLAVDLVSIGTAANTFMGPREVFRDALLRGASAVVVAHNHPSGDPEPSAADIAVTRRLAAAGRLLGVPLLDHLVVGDVDHVSLARRGACGPPVDRDDHAGAPP